MGYPMAIHLSKVCEKLLLWNRSPEKAIKCKEACGGKNVETVCDVKDLGEAEMIFTCLPTSNEVHHIVESLKGSLKPGTLIVDCTSGDPAASRDIAKTLSGVGCSMIGAPLSGGPRGAEKGILAVTVGGRKECLERAMPALDSFSNSVFHIDEDVGSGHAVKAINNILNIAHLFIATEAVLALRKEGINTERAIAAINESSGASNITQKRFPERIFTGTFDHGFSLQLMTKDVDNANRIVKRLSSQSSSAAHSCDLLEKVVEKTHSALESRGGDVDYTEIVKYLEGLAGMKVNDRP
eukprot:Nk52_evm90s2192 gene=Nk52_evmTU90s2192